MRIKSPTDRDSNSTDPVKPYSRNLQWQKSVEKPVGMSDRKVQHQLKTLKYPEQCNLAYLHHHRRRKYPVSTQLMPYRRRRLNPRSYCLQCRLREH
jgi:hypothetical protein